MVWIILELLLITASCVLGMPVDETKIPKYSNDRDNYKEEREIRSASTPMPIVGVPQTITVQELQILVPSQAKEDVSTTMPSRLRLADGGSDGAKAVSSKMRRDASWVPFWIKQAFFTPSPTQGSPYNYDGYLGKVRRDAPMPSSSTTRNLKV